MREPKKIAAIQGIKQRSRDRLLWQIRMDHYESQMDFYSENFSMLQQLKTSLKYDNLRLHHEQLGAEGAGAIRNAADRLIRWLR